jgi:membrane-bound lytic murein transglycosylase A
VSATASALSRLEPRAFASLHGFGDDDALAAFRCFLISAIALAAGRPEGRGARPPSDALLRAAGAALVARVEDPSAARAFFERWFRPHRVFPAAGDGFLTGYYEPVVAGSRVETPEFGWPLLARPEDLVSFGPGAAPADLPAGVTGARRSSNGAFVPYHDRETIERGRRTPIVWVRDAVEAFLIQVQGSAQVAFADGTTARLAYDGRNGLPYTSIGHILIETGAIPESGMSLANLKAWLRAAGLREGEAGLSTMRKNHSFVFFRLVTGFDPAFGPVAGAGVPLTPLRSIAVDRTLWSYGLPFWIEADLPAEDGAPAPFRRLMIAQDTGSAIVGPARADLFFGSGDAAGAQAGAIRHRGDFTVLMPVGEAP